MAAQAEDFRLLANSRFRRLVESRAVAQTGQNALLYTLLILVVNETSSSLHSTLLVTSWMLPSILIGIPAGGLVDVLPKRPILVLGYALRGALVVAMILSVEDVWRIYLLLIGYSAVGQLTSPAESAALPGLLQREQMAGGNSWMAFAVMVGQAAGAVALAPVALKLFGTEVSLVLAAALLFGAAFIASAIAGLRGVPSQRDETRLGFVSAFAV